VNRRTFGLTLFRGHATERLQKLGDVALLTERLDAQRLQSFEAIRGLRFGDQALFEFADVIHML